jgi:hypothetical protein
VGDNDSEVMENEENDKFLYSQLRPSQKRHRSGTLTHSHFCGLASFLSHSYADSGTLALSSAVSIEVLDSHLLQGLQNRQLLNSQLHPGNNCNVRGDVRGETKEAVRNAPCTAGQADRAGQ